MRTSEQGCFLILSSAIARPPMAVYGASCPRLSIPTNVGSTYREQASRSGGGNYSKCLTADPRSLRREPLWE